MNKNRWLWRVSGRWGGWLVVAAMICNFAGLLVYGPALLVISPVHLSPNL